MGVMNIAKIESSLRELVEFPFDPDGFICRFLEVYDAPKSTVTKLRQAKAKGADLISDGDLSSFPVSSLLAKRRTPTRNELINR